MSEELFKSATRNKLRVDTSNGYLSVEQLWDLPLTSPRANTLTLDKIAIDLKTRLNQLPAESIVDPSKSNAAAAILQNQYDLVASIIATLVKEGQEAQARMSKEAAKNKIFQALSRKEDSELEGKSAEELRKMLAEL